jgi:hypothetical protein
MTNATGADPNLPESHRTQENLQLQGIGADGRIVVTKELCR